MVKLLIQDTLKDSEEQVEELEKKVSPYKFTITADELPPKLEVSHLPYSFYEREEDRGYDWASLVVAVISGIFFTAILGTIYSLKLQTQGLYLFSFKEFFSMDTFGFLNVCILFLALLGIVAFILTIVGIIGAISDLQPDKKQKFKVPRKLRKEGPIYPFEFYE